MHVRKHFSFCEQISVTKQLSKVQRSSRLIKGICSLQYIQTPFFLESLGWSALIKVYSSILIFSSSL